ncbi:enolase-like domain-containing protein [Paracraurococcus ruber]|uniref:Mandelate racemase n=1 Tax=Paracraurococcus ruber TaxID=77675 RepID=A0ABS1CU17_9PROT|nr:mandelate racemase [Paracraurococcus ruber]MBK1657974.1 mandelate racemase [Paracraurococcus ruber]TDG30380.1 mandelate racemase [Paracraurococcus ruber]
MRFAVIAVEAREWAFTLRLPFRFGAVTVTQGRQAVLRLRIRDESGQEGWGCAAESLAAKWFDKDPALTDAQNEDQLRRSLELAAAASLAAGANTAFGHFADSYADHTAACAREGLNPLVASYGRALLDRAALDALLKRHGMSVFDGMRANIGGMVPHPIAPDLAGFDFARMLAGLQPAQRLHARHTVGLVDPITATDQTARVADGLPETLAEVAHAYGHRYWKLKVSGDVAADIDRLCRIAAVLDRLHGYHATLDGNEQYADAEGALALWRAIEAEPRLARLAASILYVEQPVRRARALDTGMAALAAARPVIIDESDGPLDAFIQARALGYSGVSSKSCKGIWRSLVNLARCRAWNADGAGCFLSAEDLTTLPGVCVQQDLALVALLGLAHVERNGHHFVAGFAGRPKAEAVRFLEAHPDLYADTPRGPRLRIRDGLLEIGSLATPGLGATEEPDFAAMAPMPKALWPPTAGR